MTEFQGECQSFGGVWLRILEYLRVIVRYMKLWWCLICSLGVYRVLEGMVRVLEVYNQE